MPHRVFRDWLSRRTPNRPASRAGLRIETLEPRDVPSVTIQTTPDQEIPLNRPIFLPVTVTNTPNGAVTTNVNSDTAAVQATVVTGGRSVQFTVSGGTGASAFTGTITIRLFENEAPLGTQRIVDLINDGYYVGKTFHRVADLLDNNPSSPPTNVIVQGGSPTGNGVGGSTLPDLNDEFNADYTFASNGLVAFANAGDDNNNAQFFFTDINRPLAQRIEFLNFNHTIFGIITDGFDTLTKMQTTPLNGTTPVSPITITAAAVLASDPKNAVIELKPNGLTAGAVAHIVVTDTDADGPTMSQFTLTGTTDSTNSRAFLGPVTNQTTTENTAVTFTPAFTDVDGDPVTFKVLDPTFATAPANVSVSIDSTTHQVTLTPNAGFVGTVQLKLGVRDQTDRSGSGLETASNYDTQAFSLTVNAPSSPPTTPPTSPPTSPPATPPTVPPAGPTTNPEGPVSAAGAAAGSSPDVVVTRKDGTTFTIQAYEPTFTGGVRTLTADVNGDGVQDVVTAPAAGGSPLVKVFDGTTGNLLFATSVFEDTFRGGVFLNTATDSTGRTLLVFGAGDTGGPRLVEMDAKTQKMLASFYTADPNSRHGVTVAVSALVAATPNKLYLIAGAGPGQGPVVTVYDADTLTPLGSFYAGDPADRTGIRVRPGAVNTSTGIRAILVAPYTSTGTDGEQPFDPSTEGIDFSK